MALCSDCSATHCFSANASARTPLSWYLSFCSLGHVPMLLDLIIFWATLGRMAATPAMPSSETGLKVLQGFNRTLYSQLTPRASIKMLTAYTQLRLVHRNLSDHCSFCSVWQQQSGPPAPASHRVDAASLACAVYLPEYQPHLSAYAWHSGCLHCLLQPHWRRAAQLHLGATKMTDLGGTQTAAASAGRAASRGLCRVLPFAARALELCPRSGWAIAASAEDHRRPRQALHFHWVRPGGQETAQRSAAGDC